MYINEIPNQSTVSVEVKIPGKIPANFKAKVVESSLKGKCIFLKPLKEYDKIINFEVPNISIDTVFLLEGKPVIWRSCVIKYLKYKGETYHAIICKNDGKYINRRDHFRVPVDAYCYVNHGKATVDALIRDISSTGFSYSVGRYDGPDMESVKVNYDDELIGINISLEGHVVRKDINESGKTVFGCHMAQRTDINRYINERQRKLLNAKKKL